MTRQQRILAIAADMPVMLSYYDRKDDCDLPVGSIEEALRAREVTPEEIVEPLLQWCRRHFR